jgi:hypothetical protein
LLKADDTKRTRPKIDAALKRQNRRPPSSFYSPDRGAKHLEQHLARRRSPSRRSSGGIDALFAIERAINGLTPRPPRRCDLYVDPDLQAHDRLADVLARLQDHPARQIDEFVRWNRKHKRQQKAAA